MRGGCYKMRYEKKVRETIRNLSEEEVKQYLGDIVVNYALREEDNEKQRYIKSINKVLKIVSADQMSKNRYTIKINTKLKV